MWYWGETCAVFGLKTRATLPAWKEECPRYTPMRDLGSHLGGPGPPVDWSRWSKTKTGQKRVWKFFTGIVSRLTPYMVDSGVWPSELTWREFIRSAMAFIANGQKKESIICGQCLMPCNRRVHALRVSCLFLFSMMPFWWCASTPQKVISWPLSSISLWNPLSVKWPLSAW